MNILVCGFMGAGKTTFVDQFRNNEEGFLVFDLDQEIANSLGVACSELGVYINKYGIEHFRQLEAKTLYEILQKKTKSLIALGGGSLEVAGFWEIKGEAKLVFLNVPFEVCFHRIKHDHNRPLAQKTKADVKDLYDLRQPLYLRSELILDEDQIKGIDSIGSLMHNLMNS